MNRLATQSMVPLEGESAFWGSLLEIQDPEPHLTLLHQNLHFNKMSVMYRCI